MVDIFSTHSQDSHSKLRKPFLVVIWAKSRENLALSWGWGIGVLDMFVAISTAHFNSWLHLLYLLMWRWFTTFKFYLKISKVSNDAGFFFKKNCIYCLCNVKIYAAGSEIVAHIFILSTWEAEAHGSLWVQGQCALCSNFHVSLELKL